MELKKFFLILVVGFFLFQNILFVSSQSCVSDLKINFGIYETHHMEDDSKLYIRSSYQPSGSDKFVRRSDVLFIESVYAESKPSCKKIDSATIQFKRPSSEDWGEDLSVTLDFTDSEVYSLELVDIPKFDSIIYRDINGKDVHPPPRKTLSNEGIWEFRIVGVEARTEFVNDEWTIPGEILVMDRIAVTQLESLRQIKGESERNSWIVIVIGIFTILAEIAGIYYLKRTSNEQIEKTQEHYEKQIQKEDEREEKKQFDLLRTLLTELTFLERNLRAYKETFSKDKHYPFYELWNIDASLYLKTLNHEINEKQTINLKENLMTLKDKLVIINNMKLESKKEEERGAERLVQVKIESLRKGIINIIDEDLLPVLKKSKKFIENNWKLKKRK